MYKVLEKETGKKFPFATLSEAKAHATKWQHSSEQKNYSVLSDGVKIWDPIDGDDKNIFTL